MKHELLKPPRGKRIGEFHVFQPHDRATGAGIAFVGIALVVTSIVVSIPAVGLSSGSPSITACGSFALGVVFTIVGFGTMGIRRKLMVSKERVRYVQNALWTKSLGFDLPLSACTHLAMKTEGEHELIWIGEEVSRVAWALERSNYGLDSESWKEFFGRLSDAVPGAAERAYSEQWPTSGWNFKMKEGWTRGETWALSGPLEEGK